MASYVILPANEYVSGFDVTVKNARPMNDSQSIQQRLNDGQQVDLSERFASCLATKKKLGQGQSVIVVHDQVRSVIFLEIVEARDDVALVPELSQLFRLVPETPQPVLEGGLSLGVERAHAGAIVCSRRQFRREKFLYGV